MEEKYYIINNKKQYFVLIKCKEQTLLDFENYGCEACLTSEGALDLFRASDWFINRKVRHTIIFGEVDNIILKTLIKKDINAILTKVQECGLLIPNEEVDNFMRMSTEKRATLFW